MNDQLRAPVSGSNHRAPKRKHGRGWLKRRNRRNGTWAMRKAVSRRYCRGTK